ncbi:MAG: hypothetical protein KDI66_20250, partial [Xanthomonadales bacterium]|nr:hypothetical protein [Xanthomonadales bacterium]
MKASWFSRYGRRTVACGAAAAGPLAAVVALTGESAGATVVGSLGLATVNFLAGVATNWFADETRDLLSRPADLGFNHDLKRAMARALSNCLADDPRQQSTLLHALRDAPLDPHHLPELVRTWRQRVDAAIESNDNVLIDRLFPPIDESTLSALSRETELAPRPLWDAFYDQSLALDTSESLRAQACGGAEALRTHVPAALAAVYPNQLAEVLKRDDGRRAWIAFQKQSLEHIEHQLTVLDTRVSAELRSFKRHFDDYVDGQLGLLAKLQFGIDGLTTNMDSVLRALGQHTQWLDALRVALRREHDPPLFTPRKDSKGADGVRALKFSERVLARTFGRDTEFAELDAFLDAPDPFLWWGVLGSAGMGKSHLALELVQRRQASGWTAGFLESGLGWIGDDAHLQCWHPVNDTLIVIDYASARSQHLLQVLSRLQERSAQLLCRVRVLLLDRPGGLAPVFSELIESYKPADADRRRALEGLYKRPDPLQESSETPGFDYPQRRQSPLVRDSQLLELRPLDRPQWRELLQSALMVFGDPRSLPPDDAPIWTSIDRLSDGGRPLLLLVTARILAGDAASADFNLGDEQRDTLLYELMRREREEVWADAAGVERMRWNNQDRCQFERGIALITLLGGLNWQDGSERSSLLQTMNVDKAEATLTRKRLGSILGFDSERPAWLRPLEPDLFGEYLLSDADVVDVHGDAMLDLADLARTAMSTDGIRTVSTLELLTREFNRSAAAWVRSALIGFPAKPPAFELTIAGAFAGSALPRLLLLVGNSGLLASDLADDGLDEEIQRLASHTSANAYAVALGLLAVHETMPGRTRALDLVLHVTPTNQREYGRLFSLGAVNVIAHYGREQDWVALERWGERLLEVAQSPIGREDREIQLPLARGAFNAINHYGSAKDWIALEHWGQRLLEVAQSPIGREDREIQLPLARGA